MELSVSFMIIGAQKCGTSALAYFLSQHPEICLSKPKEPHLFDDDEFDLDWDTAKINHQYTAHFEHCHEGQFFCDGTPIYLYLPHIAQQLYRYNPDLKLIVLLRDPIKRALSQYRMEVKLGFEHWPLIPALLFERFRLSKNKLILDHGLRHYSYLDRGFYCTQLKNLYQYFSEEQVLVLSMDNLWHHHDKTLHQVYDFLALDGNQDDLPVQELVFSDNKKDELSLPFWLNWFFRWKFRKEFALLKKINNTIN
jgi:hypothetical protein